MLALYLWMKSWLAREDGQDLIEYALIIGLMVVLAIAGLSALGTDIASLWTRIGAWLNGIIFPA